MPLHSYLLYTPGSHKAYSVYFLRDDSSSSRQRRQWRLRHGCAGTASLSLSLSITYSLHMPLHSYLLYTPGSHKAYSVTSCATAAAEDSGGSGGLDMGVQVQQSEVCISSSWAGYPCKRCYRRLLIIPCDAMPFASCPVCVCQKSMKKELEAFVGLGW
jgi:hypothetical protein